jgi:hypothetical protein
MDFSSSLPNGIRSATIRASGSWWLSWHRVISCAFLERSGRHHGSQSAICNSREVRSDSGRDERRLAWVAKTPVSGVNTVAMSAVLSPDGSAQLAVLFPRSDAVPRLGMRNSTQIGVNRVEVPIRHVPINWPRHYSQSLPGIRIDTCAHNVLEFF